MVTQLQFWDDPLTFSDVAQEFTKIEAETSRLTMTELLANLFKKASPQEAAVIAYLSLGELNPPYIGTQFNIASKSLISVVARCLDTDEPTIKKSTKKTGDLGSVVAASDWPCTRGTLSVLDVYGALQKIHDISGTGSQEKKEDQTYQLLSHLSAKSAKYVIRIILGKLRLGFSDMTLLDAFSWMHTGDKSLRSVLEEAYNVCADIGRIVRVLKEDGIAHITNMEITPGIPIRPASAERLPSAKAVIQKLGSCIAQPKLDGFRLQVHVNKQYKTPVIHFFSRNLHDMSHMFPQLTTLLKELDVETAIFEGEALAYDEFSGIFLPFQETVKRRRKHDIAKVAKELPLRLFLFDALYYNGTSLLKQTHVHRRATLEKIISTLPAQAHKSIQVIEEQKITSAEELEKYFNQNISAGLEGLVVKRPDAPYQAGKRNFNWIKFKRDESGQLNDTIDCVVLGYYAGRGKRAALGIGAFLVGVFNKQEDRFETIAKIGTGLSDDGWRELKKKCDAIATPQKPKNVVCAKELYPDIWVHPEIVCVIRADEITLSPLHTAGAQKDKDQQGYALRFPRMMGYRVDKDPHDATEIAEIRELYEYQYTYTTKK